MTTQILTSKLFVPPPRPRLVPRPHLIEQLNGGLYRRLTLVSAPAGFGKTTLVSEWIAGSERRVAWLSLDEGDNDPTRFLTYLVAALQTVEASIGADLVETLRSPQPPPADFLLTTLLNEIAARRLGFVLIIDDYHLIDARPIDDTLAFLIENLPPRVHLVLTTREDPQLPLPRLRARDQVTEIRANDLRFTPEEASLFLNDAMGLGLSEGDVAALERRTEGWIAGLQLAALSVQGRDDTSAFIESFAGDDSYIIDYLLDEVLLRQSERVRSFLLQTAILERLSGPLCNLVTGREDSGELLETLERGNLFLVPLDGKRRWFRYHHLFADVLRAHAAKRDPDDLPELHGRASRWYEKHGFVSEAVHHALAAEAFERAAMLIECAWRPMDESRRVATWLAWVRALPDEHIRTSAVISAGYAWSLLETGDLDEGAIRLEDAEALLEAAGSSRADPDAAPPVVADEAAFATLPASLATARCYHAAALGDTAATVEHARRALELTPESDRIRRGTLEALLGLSSWSGGDLSAAERSFADVMEGYRSAGNPLFAITAGFVLGQIQIAQGRLRRAARTYERSLRLVEGRGEAVLHGSADLHTALAELHLERNDLAAAQRHLRTSKELGDRASLPHWDYRWYAAKALAHRVQGDLDGAVSRLAEAERRYRRGPVPDVRPIPARRVGVWIAQGRHAEALHWARERDLSVRDDLDYLREFEHLTLARALIARSERDGDGSLAEASNLLRRLLEAAERRGGSGSTIEILVLQARAHGARGDAPSALAALERALTLAEPEGYARIFLDEGAPMARLLAECAVRGVAPAYVAALRAALDAELQGSAPPAVPSPTQANLLLDEPLSERELEVLRLLAEGLSNEAIGRRLHRALDTVKGYNRNLFGKLRVRNRADAVARAQELGLLPPAP